ncbi:MAG: tetratricopeptide repeat protein, partial [Planctomycetota bacterium]
AGESGEFKRYDPGFVEEPGRPLVELGPGSEVVHRQLVLYDNATKDYAFPAPGLYSVKAVFHRLGAAPDIESNTIRIKVADPTGTDAVALRLFKSKVVAQLIMNLNEDSEAVKRLEGLMTEHGSTTYGKYAQFYLARRQTREFFTRKPNHERAVELYRDLIQKDPRFPLIIDAKYRLGISLMKTNRYKEAKEMFNFVLKKSRLTMHQKGAKKLIGRIEKLKDKKSR